MLAAALFAVRRIFGFVIARLAMLAHTILEEFSGFLRAFFGVATLVDAGLLDMLGTFPASRFAFVGFVVASFHTFAEGLSTLASTFIGTATIRFAFADDFGGMLAAALFAIRRVFGLVVARLTMLSYTILEEFSGLLRAFFGVTTLVDAGLLHMLGTFPASRFAVIGLVVASSPYAFAEGLATLASAFIGAATTFFAFADDFGGMLAAAFFTIRWIFGLVIARLAFFLHAIGKGFAGLDGRSLLHHRQLLDSGLGPCRRTRDICLRNCAVRAWAYHRAGNVLLRSS